MVVSRSQVVVSRALGISMLCTRVSVWVKVVGR